MSEQLSLPAYPLADPDPADTQDACPHCNGPVERKALFVRGGGFLSPVSRRAWYYLCRDAAPSRGKPGQTGNGCTWRRAQRTLTGPEAAP